jgi:transposase-like protein
MSSQRYTPKFKDEAVRQVVDKGLSVASSLMHTGMNLR